MQARRFRVAVLQEEAMVLSAEERHYRHVRLSRREARDSQTTSNVLCILSHLIIYKCANIQLCFYLFLALLDLMTYLEVYRMEET